MLAQKKLEQYTVIYHEAPDITWQFFLCMAEDGEHAEEQCQNAYPKCEVLWVNEGECYDIV